jgi:hypothetical protein
MCRWLFFLYFFLIKLYLLDAGHKKREQFAPPASLKMAGRKNVGEKSDIK